MMILPDNWPVRVARGHPRPLFPALVGVVCYFVLPHATKQATRAVIAWDVALLALISTSVVMFVRDGSPQCTG